MTSGQERVQAMAADAAARFEAVYGGPPALIVRAPGRVNLIGEHTDYNGLPVLPFAIEQSHYLAAGEGSGPRIEIANADPQYAAATIDVEALDAFAPPGSWENYTRAALLGLCETSVLPSHLLERGLRVLVGSDLPSGVGLSSSSALVVGFAVAALAVNQIDADRQRLAEVLAEAEQHVGTRGGGMDQAACLLGRQGHALKIDFFPLEVDPVRFGGPGCLPVLISDSGVRVEKSGAGRMLYNRRPIECRLALALFQRWARRFGHAEFGAARHWGDLVKPPFELPHAGVLALIEESIKQPWYSIHDLCDHLAMREQDLRERYLRIGADEYLLEPADGFRLQQRAQHVISEGWRVEEAALALRSGDWPRLAELLEASHASCRDLYEISCPEVERLVGAALEAGALASRLTGAGFGGCVLHLVSVARFERFRDTMERLLGPMAAPVLARPAAGAEILALTRPAA